MYLNIHSLVKPDRTLTNDETNLHIEASDMEPLVQLFRVRAFAFRSKTIKIIRIIQIAILRMI